MIDYDFPLWRPPSEGENLIIQATLGCRYNQCGFCSMYKSKTYRERPLDEVFADMDTAAAEWPDAHRVFLADGDAYCLPTDKLVALCDGLAARFPRLQRVSAYATPFDILKKSPDEIALLKSKRLGLVYLGIESGSDEMLRRIAKGSARQMAAALTLARECGLKVSATVILGLGGQGHWQDHIDATADLVNRAPPVYLSTLQLGLENSVAPRFFERWGEDFQWQDDQAVMVELRRLVERLEPPSPVIFRSNHASNTLALAGTLPKDKPKLLAQLDAALAGNVRLRPQWIRGL
ncbi:radical SAM protein [Paramagnetospirillum kuznetsovii]|uniref:Radical SAM protein n=1 Tax=Paramagnetospirillum kuznetsovii TaxID=2053833 RepID=A0A364NVS9_9PROT|nr:radical SAM protein [Paramagnetospirillum kuznetsovii]RAU21166.1 radical SAM protein [Paramagnetospirillum kuznetsovii]